MPRLEGKIAVITGGSSGIGLATAKRFVKEGAYVFITGRRQAELDKAVAEIGSNVTAVKGDVSNLEDLDRLYQTVAAKKGKLDVLFANAGVVEPVPTAAVTTEHYDKTFGINARGVYFTVQKALPLMKDGGSIIVNGSGAWQKGIPIYSTYSATKAPCVPLFAPGPPSSPARVSALIWSAQERPTPPFSKGNSARTSMR